MLNRVISTQVSRERGEVLIKAAQQAGLTHASVTPNRPYRSPEGNKINVPHGKIWVIVETETKEGSDKFFAEVDKIELSKK